MNDHPGLKMTSRTTGLLNIIYGTQTVAASVGSYICVTKMTIITVS